MRSRRAETQVDEVAHKADTGSGYLMWLEKKKSLALPLGAPCWHRHLH